jgi:hypothetical protein
LGRARVDRLHALSPSWCSCSWSWRSNPCATSRPGAWAARRCCSRSRWSGSRSCARSDEASQQGVPDLPAARSIRDDRIAYTRKPIHPAPARATAPTASATSAGSAPARRASTARLHVRGARGTGQSPPVAAVLLGLPSGLGMQQPVALPRMISSSSDECSSFAARSTLLRVPPSCTSNRSRPAPSRVAIATRIAACHHHAATWARGAGP